MVAVQVERAGRGGSAAPGQVSDTNWKSLVPLISPRIANFTGPVPDLSVTV